MIDGGNATLFVSDMDKAVDFYTRVLGLRLRMRAGDHWAELDAGSGFVIGLHPRSSLAGEPGSVGAIQIGLNVTETLEEVAERLGNEGVQFDGGISDDGEVGRFARLTDMDGNRLYLWQQGPVMCSS